MRHPLFPAFIGCLLSAAAVAICFSQDLIALGWISIIFAIGMLARFTHLFIQLMQRPRPYQPRPQLSDAEARRPTIKD